MAEAPTTVTEWQDYFDHKFPDGALVTQVLYSEASAHSDESPQVLMSLFRVITVENESPQVSMKMQGSDRDVIVSVESAEERDYGAFLKTTEDGPNYILSNRLPESAIEAVREERGEGAS